METLEITITPESEFFDKMPICLSGNELFVVNKKGYLGVLRPVSREDLDYARSDEGIKETCRESWILAVEAGKTEAGLDEFVRQVKAETDLDDPENYILKDDSDCDVFDQWTELREVVDDYLNDYEDIEVGTWESAGMYRPQGEIQIMFNDELYEKYCK